MKKNNEVQRERKMRPGTIKEYEDIFERNRDKLEALLLLDKHDSKRREFFELLKRMPNDFGGPSIYFHKQAINAARNGKFFDKDFKVLTKHLKMIYAVLPAWGMHRMGDTATKIIPYKKFCKNIYNHLELHDNLVRRYKTGELTIANVDSKEIANFIITLNVSVSGARLVSSSKTLHHIFPDLILPMDRAYTIKFMKKNTPFDNNSPDPNNERWFVETFFEKMQHFLTKHREIKKIIEELRVENSQFNTSIPKILDNLIIAFVKLHTKEKGKNPLPKTNTGVPAKIV